MLLNLRSLNESIEKKYSINKEKNIALVEAFDESMPKWLANRIAFTNLKTGNSHIKVERGVKGTPNKGKTTVPYGYFYGREQRAIDKKYPEHGPDYTEYKKNSKTDEEGEDLNLANQLRAAGIDVSRVKIVEAPVPSTIPKKSKKRIDIFGMWNGQVWVRGVNDREKVENHSYTFKKYCKDYPDSFLSYVTHYAYIDTSDPAVGSYTDIKEKRLALKQELDNIGNYYRKKDYSYGLDRSGYKVTPTAKKYKKALDKIKYSKIDKTFEEIASRIENIKYALISALTEVDLADREESSRVLNIVEYATDYLNRANDEYLETIEFINDESFDKNESWVLSRIMDHIDRVNEYLNNAEERTEEYTKTVADW